MVWLSQHPAWMKARKVAISTSPFGLEIPTDPYGNSKNHRKVRFIVAYDYIFTFWHKRRYIKVFRSKAEGMGYYPTRSLHLRCVKEYCPVFSSRLIPSRSVLGGSHQVVQDILTEAKACWQKAKEEQVSIYASDIRNEWRLITSRRKRPLKSIILDTGVKESILEDARDFLDSKEWYSERGIPFRRGYLLVSHNLLASIANARPHQKFCHCIVWSTRIRKDVPYSKCRRGTQFGRLCHLALSSRFGRQFFAGANFGASRALYRANGRHRCRVSSYPQ